MVSFPAGIVIITVWYQSLGQVFVLISHAEPGLVVSCSASYDRDADTGTIVTINCDTLQAGQTITSVSYTVNGGDLLTGTCMYVYNMTLMITLLVHPVYKIQCCVLSRVPTYTCTYSHIRISTNHNIWSWHWNTQDRVIAVWYWRYSNSSNYHSRHQRHRYISVAILDEC